MGENQLLVDTDILIAYLNHKAYRAYLENPKNRIYYSAITKKRATFETRSQSLRKTGHTNFTSSLSSHSSRTNALAANILDSG